MGKIFDALEKAKKEKNGEEKPASQKTAAPPKAPPKAAAPPESAKTEDNQANGKLPGSTQFDFRQIHGALDNKAGTETNARAQQPVAPKDASTESKALSSDRPQADKPDGQSKEIPAAAKKPLQPGDALRKKSDKPLEGSRHTADKPQKRAAKEKQTRERQSTAGRKIFDTTKQTREALLAKEAKVIQLERKETADSEASPAGGDRPAPVDKPQAGSNKKTVPPGPAPTNIDPTLVTLLNPLSFESEQFKKLRTNILFQASGKRPRSILVTSALPGEGKSFTASNLAVSIAQNINEYVLLIDCDMRRPTIHKIFGHEDTPGLSEHLVQDTPLSDLMLKTTVPKLTILPAGEPPPNPSELLSSEKMNALIQEVKNRYADRYIIIDSPPPQVTAETAAIARRVDGILLVIKYGSTARDLVAETVEMLEKKKIIGAIVNRFDIRSSIYYGYGRKNKYYKYYGKKDKKKR